MNGQAINQLVEQLIHIDALEVSRIEDALDNKLIETEQNPESTFYEFDLKDSVFDRGEVRLAKSGDWALIILQPPDDAQIVEDDLNLDPWGEIDYLDINPDIPPEGMIAYTYESNGVLISFQFHEVSRKLSNVVVEWSEPE
jgi:hypothetical protein